MEINLVNRIKNAWNAFRGRDPTEDYIYRGPGYSYRPDRPVFSKGHDRTIITAIYNRIAVDSASIDVRHVYLDGSKRYSEDADSALNDCLTVSANIDQSGRAFMQDVVESLLDEGVVAIVPYDTDVNPKYNNSYEIYSLRTAKIVEWHPTSVKLKLYDEETCTHREIFYPKKCTCIIENPFYSVMNAPSGTLQRLLRKLSLLDAIDEQVSAGKLDLIVQLPYTIKGEARQKQAEQRRNDIIDQLTNQKYGIAYIDATENITQLNRPVENNLMSQIEYLTTLLYSQLGITQEIMNGTADDNAMTNYQTRTIQPIMNAIVEEMRRKFLTKTARSQGQSILYFNDPFRLVPVSKLPDIVDKFTRNEVMTSNEFRQIIGLKPSDDPNADELRNKNISQPADEATPHTETDFGEEEIQNG